MGALKIVDTFEAKIYLGLREGYGDIVHDISEVEEYLQSYCNDVGFCVTLTPTRFIYKNGNEDGCIIGIINYPRFPELKVNLEAKAIKIATELKIITNQIRVSIVFTDTTVLIGD